MTHDIVWLKPDSLLYVSYKGYQTRDTILECCDDMARELDKAVQPIIVLINWQEVTDLAFKGLLNAKGHRAFSHPKAAWGFLVGMDKRARMENEVAAIQTRMDKNTRYFETMDEAIAELSDMLQEEIQLPDMP